MGEEAVNSDECLPGRQYSLYAALTCPIEEGCWGVLPWKLLGSCWGGLPWKLLGGLCKEVLKQVGWTGRKLGGWTGWKLGGFRFVSAGFNHLPGLLKFIKL